MKKLVYLICVIMWFNGFGQQVLTNNNVATVINKTMDYNSNTFLNFPFQAPIKWGADFSTNADSVFLKGDWVNIKDYGALDNNSTNNSASLAAAVATGKSVWIPPGGVFRFATGITLNSGQIIFGSGPRSQLRYTGTTRAITMGDSSKCINFRLIGNGKSSGNTFETGVFGFNHINWVVQDMDIESFGGDPITNGGGGIYCSAIASSNSPGANIINCRVYSCNGGIVLNNRSEYINIIGGGAFNSTVGLALGSGNIAVSGIVLEANTDNLKIYSGTNNGHSVITGSILNHATRYAVDCQDIAQGVGIQFSGCDIYFGALFFKNANNIRFDNCNIDGIDSVHLDNSYFVHFENCQFGKTAAAGVIPINKFNGATDISVMTAMRYAAATPVNWIKQVVADTVSLFGPIYHTGVTPASSSSSDSVWVKDASTKQFKLRAQSDIGSAPVTIYTGDGSLTGDRTIDLNGHQLLFNVGALSLQLSPTGGINMTTNAGHSLSISDDDDIISVQYNGQTKIELGNGSNQIVHTADTHTFNGNIEYNGNGKLLADRVVDLNSHSFVMQGGGGASPQFYVSTGDDEIALVATSNQKTVRVSGNTDDAIIQYNSNTKIQLGLGSNQIAYTADTHTFNVGDELTVTNNGFDYAEIDPVNFRVYFVADNQDGKQSGLDLHAVVGDDLTFHLFTNNGDNLVDITGDSEAGTMVYNADTHTFNGQVKIVDGTQQNGYVFTSDADGLGSWQPASGGEVNTASNLGGGLANYSTKVGADLQFNSFNSSDFDLASNLISIDYTNGQVASGSTKGFLTSADWTTFNNKQPAGSYLTAVTADAPLSGSGTSGSHLVIANAVADGSTKGAASFTAADFNATTGNISIDYTNGQKASSSVPGFATVNQVTSTIGVGVDGQGGVVSTGSKGFVTIPYDCTITNWYVAADVSGSIQFDVKRSGTSIVGGGGNKPLLSSAISGNAAVSGWTSTAVTAGDILEWVVDSATTVTNVTMVLKVIK